MTVWWLAAKVRWRSDDFPMRSCDIQRWSSNVGSGSATSGGGTTFQRKSSDGPTKIKREFKLLSSPPFSPPNQTPP